MATACRARQTARPPSTRSCWSVGTRIRCVGQRSRRCNGNWRTFSRWTRATTRRRRRIDSRWFCCCARSFGHVHIHFKIHSHTHINVVANTILSICGLKYVADKQTDLHSPEKHTNRLTPKKTYSLRLYTHTQTHTSTLFD